MTAPEARPGGLDSNVRGLLVLAVALVVGFLLLFSWGDGGSSGNKSAADTNSGPATTAALGGTTTTAAEGTTTTAASGHTPSEVKVVVLNGSGQTGAAGTVSSTIGQSGYTMNTPGNAAAATTTTIYYAPDFQADAIAVAGVIGKNTDAVKPIADVPAGTAVGDADVVVVLGADQPPVSGTTTTTAAGGSTGSTTTTTG
ncbi:LytR C-terminal domain-containing protein [Aquihabitans sp. McL0605]|uniref:LytR C-terminal domain-containing protein n=1 Tax=Aquihabitans sp. McL0605 TaxID=3415671 RepID=UPI003CF9A553